MRNVFKFKWLCVGASRQFKLHQPHFRQTANKETSHPHPVQSAHNLPRPEDCLLKKMMNAIARTKNDHSHGEVRKGNRPFLFRRPITLLFLMLLVLVGRGACEGKRVSIRGRRTQIGTSGVPGNGGDDGDGDDDTNGSSDGSGNGGTPENQEESETGKGKGAPKGSTPTTPPSPNATPPPVSTSVPSNAPSEDPSSAPSDMPTSAPSDIPTDVPSEVPSETTPIPSFEPSSSGTPAQTPNAGTPEPSSTTPVPSNDPTDVATSQPNSGQGNGQGQNDNNSGTDDTGDTDNVSQADDTGGETVEISDTATACSGLNPDRRVGFWWNYSIELEVLYNDVDDAVDRLEQALLGTLEGKELFECDLAASRRLAADYGISGMDYKPDDLQLTDECPSGVDGCFIYRGLMELYLVPGADEEVAILESRKAIQQIMNNNELSLAGVEQVRYLAPALSEAAGLEGEATSLQSGGDDNNNSEVAVLIGVGSIFLIVAVLAAYRFRKTDDKDTALTVTGSQITGVDSNLSGGSGSASPTSPFSAMLPTAYRLNDSDTMSAILEGDSDSSNQSRSDIIVSDSGYTEEDSRDQSYLHALSNDPVLGAQKMDEYDDDVDDDYLFDTGLDDHSIILPETPRPSSPPVSPPVTRGTPLISEETPTVLDDGDSEADSLESDPKKNEDKKPDAPGSIADSEDGEGATLDEDILP